MEEQLIDLLAYFIIYSFAGWIMESVVRSFCEKKLINTGFLNGPFCPIYGTGAIIMILFLQYFKKNIILLFISSFFILTIWEYVVGFLLEKVFQTKYWDYSDHKWNIKGRVCLTNSICWGILGVLFMTLIHPFVKQWYLVIPSIIVNTVVYFVLIIVILDTVISIVKLKNIKETLAKIEKISEQMKEKLEELKEISKDKNKTTISENMELMIEKLNDKRHRIFRRLYKRVYRLKKAFPAIDTKEITEILNKKVDLLKKDKVKKGKGKEGKDGTGDLYH